MSARVGPRPAGLALLGAVFGAALAVMIQSLDATIAAVALPHMQGALSASQDEIDWVITSYITAAAIMTAPSGWLADRFGIKRTLLVAITGFTVASFLCGLAQTLDQIVIFRLLQGAFGAPLVPITQALFLDIFEPKDQGRGLTYWSFGMTMGPILGPNLGGWITQSLDWRWVFFVTVPIGVICFTCLAAFVPSYKPQRRSFDWFGFAAAGLFIGMLQLFLDRGSEKDWFGSTEIVLYAAMAALGIYVTLVHSFTARAPLLDLRVLKDRNFAGGTLHAVIFSMFYMTSTVLVPSFLQNVMGDPVGLSGELMAPRFVSSCLIMIIYGKYLSHLDPRPLTFAGVVIMAWASWRMSSWSLNVTTSDVLWNGLMQGVGSGISVVAVQSWTFSGIKPESRSAAATIYGLARNLGQSIGVSTGTVLLIRSIQINHADIAAHVTPFNRVLQSSAIQRFWNLHRPEALAALDGEVNRQSALIAYLDDFKALMFLCLMIAPILLLLRRPQRVAVPVLAEIEAVG